MGLMTKNVKNDIGKDSPTSYQNILFSLSCFRPEILFSREVWLKKLQKSQISDLND